MKNLGLSRTPSSKKKSEGIFPASKTGRPFPAPRPFFTPRPFLALRLFLALPVFIQPAYIQSVYADDADSTSHLKYALVIGNADYQSVEKLGNPVNDAEDVSTALASLGFEVTLLKNAALYQMEDAAVRFKEKLQENAETYGFFFYAGHGVQASGQNFLIPVDAQIASESFLRTKAFSVQILLDELESAGNTLNVVVLDACRDNPFSWSRGRTGVQRGLNSGASNQGLAVITSQPAGTIIVYATSAGSTAADGAGRNGLFTSQLLKNLVNTSLEVKEIFNRTGADVLKVSGGRQFPELSIKFFGEAYFSDEHKIISKNKLDKNIFGLWSGTVSYTLDGKTCRDFYELNFLENAACELQVRTRMGNYDVRQFGEASWTTKDGVLYLDCDFFNPIIERLNAIHWASRYDFEAGSHKLNLNINPAPAYDGTVKTQFVRTGN